MNETTFDDTHEYVTVVCICCGVQHRVPVYCGNRFCNICSSQRQKRVKNRINWLIKNRTKENGTLLKHLTLTITNSDNLAKMTKHLVKSFRKLRNRKYFKQHIIGGAFVIELTNKGNQWHAHIHAVVQSYRVDWETLRDLWIKCSHGSRGVFIQNIPPVQAVRYLTKYISKSELPEELQQEASCTLKNYRLFNPFGSWYDINRKYVPPIPVCSKCGEPSSYLPYEIVFGLWDTPNWFR